MWYQNGKLSAQSRQKFLLVHLTELRNYPMIHSLKKMKFVALILSVIMVLMLAGAWTIRNVDLIGHHEVGESLDSLNGVIVYYNGAVDHVSGRNLAKGNYNLGLKWQCVEFVKRYYYEYLNHEMPDSYGHAKDFFEASIPDGQRNRRRALIQYHNPGKSRPELNDLVVFRGTVFNPYGHVAIVSHVTDGEVEIIQQNPGPTAPPRMKFALHQTENGWEIDNDLLVGWLRKE